MTMKRINLGQANPDLYKKVVELDQLAMQQIDESGINHGFAHLLKLRASQINQCAFCVRLHSRDALSSGESADRLSVLPAWRESGYFNSKERAALALTEAVTLISVGQIPDEVYTQAAQTLSEAEIAAVEWLAIVINAWNRIAISSRYPVNP